MYSLVKVLLVWIKNRFILLHKKAIFPNFDSSHPFVLSITIQ